MQLPQSSSDLERGSAAANLCWAGSQTSSWFASILLVRKHMQSGSLKLTRRLIFEQRTCTGSQ
eukprot:scaffold4478_cov107-Skeletonema_dohrnii-CCMP3373.AAC.5